MSIRLVVDIMEQADLPRPWVAVLLAMADHADDDGENCYPSVDRIAWKANYKPRHVINVMRELEKAGVITKVRAATQHRPAEYKISLDQAPKKLPFEDWRRLHGRGAISNQGCNLTTPGVQSHNSGVQSHNSRGALASAPEPLEEPLDEPLEEPLLPSGDGGDAQLSRAEMFEIFWKRYPKGRGSKKASRAQWDRLKVDATLFEQILAGLDAWHGSHEWREPRYVRYCESWLKHQLWENPPEPWTPEPPKLRDRATNHSGDDSFRRKWGLGPYAGDAPPDGVIDVEGAAR